MFCSRPPWVAAEGRRNPFTSPLLIACCSQGLLYTWPAHGGHGQQCCLLPWASAATALALSSPAAMWQMWSRTHGASAAVHPRATDGQPALGGTGVSSRSPGQVKPRAGAVGAAAEEAAPCPFPSRANSGPSVSCATAQVFNQINFYHNQSDWSVESKRAFPSH